MFVTTSTTDHQSSLSSAGESIVTLNTYVSKMYTNTNMSRLTTGIRSEKCVVRRFRRCANVIECTYTIQDIIAYYTPSLLILGYKPVQHVTVMNNVGKCNTMVIIII